MTVTTGTGTVAVVMARVVMPRMIVTCMVVGVSRHAGDEASRLLTFRPN